MCGFPARILSKNGLYWGKSEKKVDLENEAHFEDVFQIYPSMLEKSTAEFTISTLVQ